MFTGFDTENTPNVKVWDLWNTNTFNAKNSIALTDDCAPIQFFKTGGQPDSSSLWINVYLPSAPIEGKVITIINARFGSYTQSVRLQASDVNGTGTSSNAIYNVGPGQSVSLFYSKNCISFSSSLNSGRDATGWVTLNNSASSAANAGSFAQGYYANASGVGSFALCQNGTASGPYSGTFGGDQSTASGQRAIVLGGGVASGSFAGCFSSKNGTSNGTGSVVIGGTYGFSRAITGAFVTPASDDPFNNGNNGESQSSILILARRTTDATPTVLASDPYAVGTSNQLTLPNNSAYYFKGSIVAGVSGGNSSAWSFEGLIKRGANAAATAFVGTPVLNLVAQDAGASTWVVALTANTTTGGITVTVTGQAATTIKWVARINTTERAY